MKKTFIRNGPYCQCQRSCNSLTGKLLPGLSVYECEPHDKGTWKPKGYAWCCKNAKQKWQRKLANERGWFLVEGCQIGIGDDTEPLLKEVEIKATLEWNETEKVFFEVLNSKPILSPSNHPGYEYENCMCEKSIQQYLESGR